MYNDIETLNESDKALLKSVLAKDISQLTPEDLSVLNARRSYLTYAQRQAYKGIIIDDLEEESNANPQTPPTPTTWTDPQTQQVSPTAQAPEPPVNQPNEANPQVLPSSEAQVSGVPDITPAPEDGVDNQESVNQEAENQSESADENPYDVTDPNTLA